MKVGDFFSEQEIDEVAVKTFATEMNSKLADKRNEGKHGWHDPDILDVAVLHKQLLEHAEKGDMVDIANFAMMIWNRERFA